MSSYVNAVHQVIFLEGVPPIAELSEEGAAADRERLAQLQERFLLPLNRSHVYLFPGSVKNMHPEFDAALDVLLKTDPLAMVRACIHV